LEEKLNEKEYKSLEEKKLALIYEWNRIPISLCKKLCQSFDHRINHVYETRGGRLKLNPVRVIIKYQKTLKFNRRWNDIDEIETVVYKD
jgi:hypothetical protein